MSSPGYTQIPDHVMLTLLKLPPPAVKVYLDLRRRQNRRTGQCNPGIGSISTSAEMERKTVYSALQTLEGAGLIVRHRTNRSNCYQLPDTPADIPSNGTSKPDSDIPRNGTSKPLDIPSNGTPGCPVKRDTNHKKGTIQTAAQSGGARAPRRRDVLFEAVAEVCGLPLAELTASARGRLNRATKELRDLDATPAEVCRRADAYRRTYPTATLTPTALTAHWPALNGQHAPDPDRVTTAELDAICPLVEPTEDDFAWLALPDPTEARHE